MSSLLWRWALKYGEIGNKPYIALFPFLSPSIPCLSAYLFSSINCSAKLSFNMSSRLILVRTKRETKDLNNIFHMQCRNKTLASGPLSLEAWERIIMVTLCQLPLRLQLGVWATKTKTCTLQLLLALWSRLNTSDISLYNFMEAQFQLCSFG